LDEEKMNNEFTKIKSGSYVRYVLEDGGSGGASSGGTSSGSIASMDTPIGKDQIVVQSRMGTTEPPKPRNFVAKNAKMGGAGKMKDKSKTLPRHEKHKKPVAENFNGEYDDEAGIAHSNLLTTARAVMGLLKTIKDRDNLPEWGQEKIAKAEMMLVSVWDYLQSQKEQGIDPKVAEGYGRNRGYQHGFASPTAPSLGQQHRDHDRGDDEPQGMFMVMIDGRPWKEFTSNTAFERAKAFATKNPDRTVQVRWPSGQLNTIKEQGVAEGSEDKIKQLKADHATAVHWSKNETSPQKREAARQKAEKIKAHLEKQYKQGVAEEWSQKYKSSINCSHPKGFSQKAHCAGKKKHNEDMTMEATCPDCGMCETHGNVMEIKKGAKDSNGVTKCWSGYHAAGTKKGKNGGQVRACEPNEDVAESDYTNHLAGMLENLLDERSKSKAQWDLMHAVAHNPQFANQVKIKPSVGQEFSAADSGHERSALPDRVLKKK
jgi:hypothetical protein